MVKEAGQGCLPTDHQLDYPRYVVPLEQCYPPGFLGAGDAGISKMGKEGVNY